jgi:hypothetical protein
MTVAPVTGLGPALVTVMAYVTEFPATAVAWPSVLVIDRSAGGPALIFATKAS